MTAKTVCFICRACNGTGRSRYREYSDCDACDGQGTVASRLTLSDPDPVVRDPEAWAAVAAEGWKHA